MLRRLIASGAAYQAADVVAKIAALVTLPIYTRALTRADYGTAELLLALVILVSILVRLGLGEALVRYGADPAARRELVRTAVGGVLVTTTVSAASVALLAAPVSELVLGRTDAAPVRAAALGLWAFTNLELAQALLRIDERRTLYLASSLINVALTIGLTVTLVVALDQGATGLLLGNYAASAVVLVALWAVLRPFGRPAGARLRPMLAFGLPLVPAELAVFALNVLDRAYLYRVEGEAAAGEFSLAVKLAAVMIVTVRAFQLAWPPLIYGVEDDRVAARLFARVALLYVLGSAVLVAALALLGRWVVRLLAAPEFFGAHEALPWVALGWALYGLSLVLVTAAGRAEVTTRNAPAATVGLLANALLLVLLVPPFGIAGAGIALAGAYVIVLAVLYSLTRRLFPVPYHWRAMGGAVAAVAAVVAVTELAAPADGATGFAVRAAVVSALALAVAWTARRGPGVRAG